jgi:ABC-type antimicrobial peptide transport system permease subunit
LFSTTALTLAQHHNPAPNLALTEIEIQSQKLAPHHTKRLLVIYTRTTLSLACLLCTHTAPYTQHQTFAPNTLTLHLILA